jgi:photosystem II stability/assembly factor-like uncharacterized protein
MQKLKFLSVIGITILSFIFTACEDIEEGKKDVNLAQITTTTISDITQNSAKTGGDISDTGNGEITAKGVCWSTSQNPGIGDEKSLITSDENNFETILNNLTANTTYYVRAFATNGAGTAYGNEVSFTTLPAGDENALATNPTPANGATDIPVTTKLNFDINNPVMDYYELYIDKKNGSGWTMVTKDLKHNNETYVLEEGTTYEWKVIIIKKNGQPLQGDVWSFTTEGNGGGNGDVQLEFDWKRIEPSLMGSWRSTAISGNGQFIYAAAYGTSDGRLYVSGDKGAQWIELMPAGDVTHRWNAIAVCKTGENIIVGGKHGRLYHSTNYGQDWTELQLSGDDNKHWNSASISDDGSVIVVTTIGKVFVSKNSGKDWAAKLANEFESYSSSAISSDGKKIVVTRYDHRVVISNDSGDSWNELANAGSSSWRSVASSTDGNILLVCSNTKILISNNQGTSWTDIKPSNTTDFYAASMSNDGKMIVLVEMDGKVRISGNGGSTWEIQNLIPNAVGGYADGKWTNPSVSRDGSFCLVPEAFYRLFIGEKKEDN